MSLVERALDSGPVMLDDALLREVQRSLGAAGVFSCVTFALVELCDLGLRTAVVDAGTGVRLIERSDEKLTPRLLDLAVADHLVRTGRVACPESAEWAGELIDVVADIRARLATSDGAFAMGTDHIGLLRVSRRDLVAALHPHLMAAQALWQATALNSELPVGAIVFMPEHSRWPGLFATLAQQAPIPAVALSDPRSASRMSGRHLTDEADETYAHLPGVALVPGVVPDLHVVPMPTVEIPAESVPDVSRVDSKPAAPQSDSTHSAAAPEPAAAAAESDVEVRTPEPESGAEVMAAEVMAAEVVEAAADVHEQPAVEAATAAVPESTPEPEPVVENEPEPVVEPEPRLPEPVAADAPATAAGSVAASRPVPVTESVPVRAPDIVTTVIPAFVPPIADAPPRLGTVHADPLEGPRFTRTREQDVYFPSSGERTPISVHDHRDVKRSPGPRHYSPPVPMAGSASNEAHRVHKRRLLIGAAVVGSAAVAGLTILTLPWIDGGSPDSIDRTAAAATSSQVPPPATQSAPTTSRPPIDVGSARGPITQYTAPPPPPPTAQAPARVPPRRTTPARPRPRSIPTPIPGLPPILLP